MLILINMSAPKSKTDINVMIDLETLSTRPHAAIIVIGAIKFKKDVNLSDDITQENINKTDSFYRRITIDSCMYTGLHFDPDTEKWWKEQDNDVRYEALENPDRVHLVQALFAFSEWLHKDKENDIKVWGNGSNFDCTILGEAYTRVGMEIPWKFWNVRDLRTIMDIGGVKMKDLPTYNKHNAIYDCYRQIIGYQRSIKNLGV